MDPQVEKLLKLPTQQKIIILVVVLIIEAAAMGYWLCYPEYKALAKAKEDLAKLQTEIEKNSKVANNLVRLQKEYDQLNKDLALALTELPDSKQIPTLLTTITTAGKNKGLDFITFRPKPEVPKDFYAEVPVDIVVSGSYASVGNFFAEVAKLSRIVNITNVSFSEIKSEKNIFKTKVTCLATTFRFLDEKEIKKPDKPKPQKAAATPAPAPAK